MEHIIAGASGLRTWTMTRPQLHQTLAFTATARQSGQAPAPTNAILHQPRVDAGRRLHRKRAISMRVSFE